MLVVLACVKSRQVVSSSSTHLDNAHLRSNNSVEQKEEDGYYWERLLQETQGSIVIPTVSPVSTPSPSALPTPSPTTSPTSSPTTSSCTEILWSDEFNSNDGLDESFWSYDEDDDGFGNQELQTYTRDNLRVQGGSLIITAREETKEDGTRSFTSSRIDTQDKVAVLYGNIEARIKVPNLADGLWPAFWTIGGNYRQVGWPSAGELDIMEMGSAEAIENDEINRRVTSAAHWENEGSRTLYSGAFVNPTNLNDGEFHIFRMEWTPTRVTTYVDDNEIWFIDIGLDVCTDCTEFHQPHFIILNMAVGGIFTGILGEEGVTAAFPADLEVDYVRVCDNGNTLMTGSAIEDPVEYNFNCGSPDTCTNDALNNYAGEFKCGDRIAFLIESGLSEEDACRQVAGQEFSSYCGVCIPQVIDCGRPEMCTDALLDTTDAQGVSCRDRIAFLVGIYGQTQEEACNAVAGKELPAQCNQCTKIDCDMPETCTDQVLDSDTAGVPCRDRIRFLMGTGLPELEACDRVAGVEFNTECGLCNPPLDCNRPDQCTEEVLKTDAGGFTCGERLTFLINSQGLSEVDACNQIASIEFPAECGPCNPIDCNIPASCTREALAADAGGFSCGDRINFLINDRGLSEVEACNRVASIEFPVECRPCNPIDCGVPALCTDAILNADTGGVTCRDRIIFEINNSGLSELDACRQVSSSYADECGQCKPFDCGLAGVCTDAVLDTNADGFTCGARIAFLISTGLSETEACRQVAGVEFPNQCGACNTP